MSDGNEFLYDFKKRSDESGLVCPEHEGRTVQSDMEDADINVIVARFGITGKLPENFRLPMLEDYDEIFDFHTAQQRIVDAETEFMKLPASIRKEFDHDPGQFFEFAINPDNIDVLREMGLAKAKEPVSVPVPPVDPAPVVS